MRTTTMNEIVNNNANIKKIRLRLTVLKTDQTYTLEVAIPPTVRKQVALPNTHET